jgi:hypothetical protein
MIEFAELDAHNYAESHPSAVMPRESGASSIPEASRVSTNASGILDRPVKPGDDIEYAV